MDQERIKKLAGIMSEDVETDEDLINKVAMWIYHESDSPISEIEHLVKKADAVGEYMDAVSEHKETGITEIERNPGDRIQNHLDDIDKYVDMLEEDELDIDHYSNLIRNAVEKIRYLTADEHDIRY